MGDSYSPRCRLNALMSAIRCMLVALLVCVRSPSCHGVICNNNTITSTSSSSSSQAQPSHSRVLEVNPFHALEWKFEATCGNRTINKVLNREESDQNAPNEERDWSLHSDAMKSFMNSTLRHCRTVEEILRSSEAAISPEVEKLCRIRWLNREEICDTLGRYSNIDLVGDSLTRHLNGGLSMILSEDFEHGSYGLNVDQLPDDVRENCRCDGQFSEAGLCRQYCPGSLSPGDFQRLHQCPGSVTAPLNVLAFAGRDIGDPTAVCYDGSPALSFVWLQGGSHFESNPETYFTRLRQTLLSMKAKIQNCNNAKMSHHFRVLFSGVPVVAPEVAEKYPYESKPFANSYFEGVVKMLKAEFPAVVPVSFLNLTEYASSHGYTSDGFHQLSDANMIKAMTVLNLMHALAIEPAYNVSLFD